MAACLQVLARSEHAAEDRATLALEQLAFWLMAATDGHANNFSIHHHRGGHSLEDRGDGRVADRRRGRARLHRGAAREDHGRDQGREPAAHGGIVRQPPPLRSL